MNKKIFTLLLTMPFLLASCSYNGDTQIMMDGDSYYQEDFSLRNDKFEVISKNLDARNSFCLYLSLEGCSHCEAFTPVLTSVTGDLHILTFTLDYNKDATDMANLFATYPVFTTTEFPSFFVVNKGEAKLLEFAKINSKTRLKNSLRKEISFSNRYYFNGDTQNIYTTLTKLEINSYTLIACDLSNDEQRARYMIALAASDKSTVIFIHDSPDNKSFVMAIVSK